MEQLRKLQIDLNKLQNEKSLIDDEILRLRKQKQKLSEKIDEIKLEIETIQNQSNHSDIREKFSKQTYEWSEKAKSLLKTVFFFDEFRSHQLATINAILNGLDVILIMPTGGGKSLCFQMISLLCGGLTIVISPLISLIEDQLNELNKLNISAKILNKDQNKEESNKILKNLEQKQLSFRILYVTPEKLKQNSMLMKQLDKCYHNNNLKLIVIDEVHCCSIWGHNFRRDYQFLNNVHRQFSKTPILGLTATATNKTIQDIINILDISGCCIFKDSFYRSNLYYSIQWNNNNDDDLNEIIKLIKNNYKNNESGLIYCLKTNDVDNVVKYLRENKINAKKYYADLSPEQKNDTYQKWYNGQIQIIVATIAFGMGINKNNVRFVIHYQMPKSLENYYQETGRAGRDGQLSNCILFIKYNDVFNLLSMIFDEYHGKDNAMKMLKFCLNNYDCRKKLIAEHFNDEWNDNEHCCDKHCDNCCKKNNNNNNDEINSNILYQSMIDLEKIITNAFDNYEKRLTPLKLLELWLGNGEKKLRVNDLFINKNKIKRNLAEKIILHLLINNYLDINYNSSRYSIIVYLVVGELWRSQQQQQESSSRAIKRSKIE